MTKTCRDSRDGPGAVLSETVATVLLSTSGFFAYTTVISA